MSTAAKASLPHPKPPKGIRAYENSISTQQHAAASGHQRRFETRFRMSPRTAKNSASNAINSTAIQMPSTWIQLIEMANMAKPYT